MALAKGTNSYSTEAEADAYFADSLHSDDWDSAITAIKEKALVTATRMLDRQNWQGQKTAPAQPLQFPRTGLVDKDSVTRDSATVPVEIEQATYELALALISDDATQTNPTTGSTIKKVDAQGTSVEFFQYNPGDQPRFPAIIDELVSQFLDSRSNLVGCSTNTGENLTSQFGNNFGLTHPYA